jgi:hypothetical protein
MTDPTPNPDAASATPPTGDAALLLPALTKIKANLELLLGKPVVIASSTAGMAPAADIVARAPANGMALGVQASGAVEGRIHCVVAQPLVIAMTCLTQMKAPEAIVERLAAPPELAAAERDGAKEAGSFITAALGDFAKETTGGRIVLAPSEPRFLPEDGALDCSGSDEWAVIEARVEVAPAPVSVLLIAAPAAVVAVWKPPEPASVFGAKVDRPPAKGATPAAGGASVPASAPGTPPAPAQPGVPAAWIAGREAFVNGIREAVGEALAIEGMPSLPQLIATSESAPAPALVVVEVTEGQEFQLDMIAALRHDPALCDSALVVALEAANRRNVIRCGSLGILDVVPADLEGPTLAERLVRRARAASKGK